MRLCQRLKAAHFLPAKDCLEAFGYFDKDDSGRLGYEELKEAIDTALAPAQVDMASFEGETFTPSLFRTLVERLHREYRQFNVAGNLMKFIKEQREAGEQDDMPITDKALKKLFNAYDKDSTGELSIIELLGILEVLKLPLKLIADGRALDGSCTFGEFCGIIRDIDAANQDLDVDEKVNSFVASLGDSDPPDINPNPSVDDDPQDTVDEEDPPKKKALLVGINYYGSNCELGGCINDANNQKTALLEHFGFEEDNIRSLTDDQEDASFKPTAANMRAGLEWLIDGAEAGDYLFFAYSGHGSHIPCSDGTETDGQTEILCPLDLQDDWYANCIKDDYLYDVFFNRVPEGVRCLCVYDCCHSGTMSDLSCTREFHPPWEDDPDDKKDRFFDPPEEIAAAVEEAKAACQEPPKKQRRLSTPDDTCNKLIWTISGCQDNQTSADATIDGQRQGALTWALLSSLKGGGHDGPWMYRYGRLLTEIRKKLRNGGFSQLPGMASSADEMFRKYYLANHP